MNGDEMAEYGKQAVNDGLPMSLREYARYGRQMILPSFGLPGQLRLRQARVLVVGAGGLGCPSIQYLAAAGVGYISVVDHDVVETSNLARQILHDDARVGMNKAESASIAARRINPHITMNPIPEPFSVRNAVSLVRAHDVVLDCTDNVLTRYLISDAAVLCERQVVSGAAQGVDGQLVTLHKDLRAKASCSGISSSSSSSEQPSQPTRRGPCYRCLFPKAPKPESVTDCEDGGVLGTITGLVGTMQALEAVNLLVGISASSIDDEDGEDARHTYMTLASPFSVPPFRSMKLRSRRIATCRACGDPAQMADELATERVTVNNLTDEQYMTFCGLSNPRTLHGFSDVSVTDLQRIMSTGKPRIVDVRPEVEYAIARLPHTDNITLRLIDADPVAVHERLVNAATHADDDDSRRVYVLCRRGNDSRLACHALAAAAETVQPGTSLAFFNVQGGLRAWSNEVDGKFPVY